MIEPTKYVIDETKYTNRQQRDQFIVFQAYV